MPKKRVNVAGKSVRELRLWNTYVYWALLELDPAKARSLRIGNQSQRISEAKAAALRSIIFAAFVLEFRLKRVQEVLGVPARDTVPLGVVLADFESRVTGARRLDDRGTVRLPARWPLLLQRLRKLKDLRNDIAHAKYGNVLRVTSKSAAALRSQARRSWRAVVDAIAVTNRAIGYDSIKPGAMTVREAAAYYARLRVT